MYEKHNSIGGAINCSMEIVRVRGSFPRQRLFLIFILLGLFQFGTKAQDSFTDAKETAVLFYDEIPILVIIEGYKNFYTDALYANDDQLYVNVADLFHSLAIRCIVGQKGDSLGGYIENESQSYFIDYNQGQIKAGTKIISVKNGLIKENGALYLESSLFDAAFGIMLTFNYRALTIILKSGFELPVIKLQRQEKMRENIARIKGEEITDTVVGRNYHLFRFGMLDWSAASYQTWNGTAANRFGLGVGAELFHGEADIAVDYFDRQKFDNRQLFYIWRWVDNDKKIIKQAQLGRISNQTISFMNAPVIGAVIRNSPTTVRKATGYYTLTEFTEPNWTVELYINNVMVDYTRADASGLYVFKVPNVYGYTTLKLKFYGPLGEERTEERTMNVPYTVMPAQEFEYSLSAGVLQDGSFSRFGRGEFNYGISRILTVGGGLEYLSSITNGAFIPFARTTVQPYSKLTFTGEYAHGVKIGGLLDYYFWKDALFEIDYTKFKEGQLATRFNALEEQKVKLSIPFRVKQIIFFTKFDYTRLVYKGFNFNRANATVSTYYKQFSASSSTQGNWIDNKPAYVTSGLSLSYRIGKGFTLRPSAEYHVGERKLMSYKAAVEKSIPKGYLAVAYERNLLFEDHFFSLLFRYDLRFARTNISVSRSHGKVYTSESAQGSLAFGSGNNHVHRSNNPSIGKGGISLYPFLDVNQNGIFDDGEHMVKLTSVKVMGSKAVFSGKDSIVRIPDLYAFTNCIVEFNDTDLDNIAWRFKNKKYQVLVDPNQFKRVDIPIISVGEVNGMAYINDDDELKGLGRILVKFYERNSKALVAETLSESDGYISFLGLEPGEYIAQVDSTQLKNLDFTVNPATIDFMVKTLEEGDIVEGIDFILRNNESIQEPVIDSFPQMCNANDEIIADSTRNVPQIEQHIENTSVWGTVCTLPGRYYVQCGAFRYKSNAMRMGLEIVEKTDSPVGIVFTDELYKVQVGCVETRPEAEEIRNKLIEQGVFDDLFFKRR